MTQPGDVQQAACLGKIGYPTRAEAQYRVIRQATRKRTGGNRGGRPLKVNIYRCRHCNNFHLGGNKE